MGCCRSPNHPHHQLHQLHGDREGVWRRDLVDSMSLAAADFEIARMQVYEQRYLERHILEGN